MNIDTPRTFLGGLSPSQFMRQHWQKRPLFVRAGFPDFKTPIARSALLQLARDPFIESRLVRAPRASNPAWSLKQGPFNRLPANSATPWSLLVQGVNFVHDDTDAFLDHFRFIPNARLDDVMVSLANRGGGVGAHYDSYDVFLIQAAGTRRWRIGHQTDLRLVPDVPLKLLTRFQAQETFQVRPGDVLYLPPQWAHEGVATSDDCMTLSVGFRSPTGAELARAYADFIVDRLAERSQTERRLRDPQLAATHTPAEVPQALQDFMRRSAQSCANAFQALALQTRNWQTFLGEWLSEPAAHLYFESISSDDDTSLWPRSQHPYRLRLDARSRCIRFGSELFINGERWPGRASAALMTLADQRQFRVKLDGSQRIRWQRLSNPSSGASVAEERWRLLSAPEVATLTNWLENGWIRLDVLSTPHIKLT